MSAVHRTAQYQKDRAALRKAQVSLSPPARLPCCLCWGRYGPIRYDLAYPHPLSFSSDHTLAVWRTGKHTGPMRPAHLHCQRQQGGREAGKAQAAKRAPRARPRTAERW